MVDKWLCFESYDVSLGPIYSKEDHPANGIVVLIDTYLKPTTL